MKNINCTHAKECIRLIIILNHHILFLHLLNIDYLIDIDWNEYLKTK